MRDEDKDGGRGLQLVKAEDDQNVRFQKIFITPPPSLPLSWSQSLEIPKGVGVQKPKFPRGMGEYFKSNIFPGDPRTLSKGNYQDRICDLVNQQIHELQYISVYSNAIHTFSGHFRANVSR